MMKFAPLATWKPYTTHAPAPPDPAVWMHACMQLVKLSYAGRYI